MSVKILQGDSFEQLKTLPDNSVHCCVTSPPYWGLRNYGVEGQLGNEKTVELYVENMVRVFREVKRVLREDGTFWLNIGDSYAGSNGNGYKQSISKINATTGKEGNTNLRKDIERDDGDCKPKDLVGVPWLLALALRKDGWYLRQDIIWHKPNPMPESVLDRCTRSHEYIFLLSKSRKYFFDSEAIKEKGVIPAGTKAAKGSAERAGMEGVNSRPPEYKVYDGFRNKRDVWTVTVRPYRGAHFATFPPDLIKPCVLAGCPIGGTVLDPFGGSGTTGQVATELGRDAILIELNPDYVKLIGERLAKLNATVS